MGWFKETKLTDPIRAVDDAFNKVLKRRQRSDLERPIDPLTR